MTHAAQANTSDAQPKAVPATYVQPISTLGFDWGFTLLCTWFVVGLLVDTWAHTYGVAGANEIFVTPWHIIFYAGYAAVTFRLLTVALRNRRAGAKDWPSSVPVGYELALLGLVVFCIGGGLDPLWHEVIGREVQLEVLLSPTHLTLSVGMILTVSSPLRAAWKRPALPGRIPLRAVLPAILSINLVHWLISFDTGFTHPVNAFASNTVHSPIWYAFSPVMGVGGLIIHVTVMMGLLLFLLRRWDLPFGAITLFVISHWLFAAPQNYQYAALPPILAAIGVGAVLCDLLYHWLSASYARPTRLYLFAFLMPVILNSLYMFAAVTFDTTWWSEHVIFGAILISGLTGLGVAVFATMMARPIPAPAQT